MDWDYWRKKWNNFPKVLYPDSMEPCDLAGRTHYENGNPRSDFPRERKVTWYETLFYLLKRKRQDCPFVGTNEKNTGYALLRPVERRFYAWFTIIFCFVCFAKAGYPYGESFDKDFSAINWTSFWGMTCYGLILFGLIRGIVFPLYKCSNCPDRPKTYFRLPVCCNCGCKFMINISRLRWNSRGRHLFAGVIFYPSTFPNSRTSAYYDSQEYYNWDDEVRAESDKSKTIIRSWHRNEIGVVYNGMVFCNNPKLLGYVEDGRLTCHYYEKIKDEDGSERTKKVMWKDGKRGFEYIKSEEE